MARLAREEIFSPDEIAIVHVMNRVVRRCFLLGMDPLTGKNYDHRKPFIEGLFEAQARFFGIDLICFAILSNHFHLVLRSRPDVVATWDDTQVARRWLMLCPARKMADGSPAEPNEAELNSIRCDPEHLQEIRSRLSDISWWMRLLCQKIAQRANREDEASGKFFQDRFRAVRILDEMSLLACAAYVDLNPIRAALAVTLESSDFTSVQRRIESLQTERDKGAQAPDRFLAPLTIDELRDALGPQTSTSGFRCSDKGFLAMSPESYIQLLDWTARQVVPGKCGATPTSALAILERVKLAPETWVELVSEFGRLFNLVAGRPQAVDEARSRRRHTRFHARAKTRQLLAS